jgi:hypothetical protein
MLFTKSLVSRNGLVYPFPLLACRVGAQRPLEHFPLPGGGSDDAASVRNSIRGRELSGIGFTAEPLPGWNNTASATLMTLGTSSQLGKVTVRRDPDREKFAGRGTDSTGILLYRTGN